MKYVEAPNDIYSSDANSAVRLFLAGGITNCPNWQQELVEVLMTRFRGSNLVVYNPRRDNFPIDDPNASDEQITWEFDKLQHAHLVSFWFARGSLNPIVLYELGMWGNSRKRPMVVGCDPEYPRIQDVIIQTKLARPRLPVITGFDDFMQSVMDTTEQLIRLNSGVPQIRAVPSDE